MRMLQTNVCLREAHIRWQAHGKAEYMLMHIPMHIIMVFCFFMVPASFLLV